MISCASSSLQSIVTAWLADVTDTPADQVHRPSGPIATTNRKGEEHLLQRYPRAFDNANVPPGAQTKTLRPAYLSGRSPLATRTHNNATPLPRVGPSAGASDHNCVQPSTMDKQWPLASRPMGRGRQLDRPQAQPTGPPPHFGLGDTAGPSTPQTTRKRKVDKRGSPHIFDVEVGLMLSAGQYDGVDDTPRADSSHNALVDNVNLPPPTTRSNASQSAESEDGTTSTSRASKKSRSQSPKKPALQHGQDKFHFNDFSISGSAALPPSLQRMKEDIEEYNDSIGILPASFKVRTRFLIRCHSFPTRGRCRRKMPRNWMRLP